MLENLKHSYVDLDDPRRLEFDYIRWIGDAIDGAAPRGEPLDGVFLGGAGFTLPRYLLATRPGSRARVLEVDDELVDLARERLGLRTGPRPPRRGRRRAGDAADEPTASADVLVGDAFSARSIPWHLATVEFAREIRRVLRPGGVYALNLIDQPPLKLLRAEAATLLAAFGDVALVAPARRARRQLRPAGVGAAAAGGGRGATSTRRAHARRARPRFAAGAEPLRDLDAPADQLLSRAERQPDAALHPDALGDTPPMGARGPARIRLSRVIGGLSYALDVPRASRPGTPCARASSGCGSPTSSASTRPRARTSSTRC